MIAELFSQIYLVIIQKTKCIGVVFGLSVFVFFITTGG